MTLVIMAAGMGSRFGGLKQIEPVGPNGEFIIDYSIYDAIKAGFSKVVFIIKKENYDIFRDTIGKRIEGKIEAEYVFQDFSHVPEGVNLPSDRVKPLGTVDAILFSEEKVNEPFVIINADDFYGREAFTCASEFIKNNKNQDNYGLIGYKVGNTLTENGSVKRGVCQTEGNSLVKLIESKCERVEDGVLACPLDGSTPFKVTDDTTVSMNMFVFYPNIYPILRNDLESFLRNNIDNLDKAEFVIPDLIFDHIKSGDKTVEVVPNHAVWKGVTYKEDLQGVKDYISEQIEREVYPLDLYR